MSHQDQDFEEAFEVIKVNDTHFKGKYPLRLPLPAARGVYGGNLIAQTLKVAMESSPQQYVPQSFHSFFVAPGKKSSPMDYKVTTIGKVGDKIIKQSIQAIQKDQIKFTALVSLVRVGAEDGTKSGANGTNLHYQLPPQSLHHKYNPDDIHSLVHTDYIRNAYSDEFVDYKLVPQEQHQSPANRWVNVWSGIVQPGNHFRDAMTNFVGLASLSDSVFLTTLARILHAPWNPTETRSFEEVDLDKDARMWMNVSLNALHIFHYNAMSLDHHLYFHTTDPHDFDVASQWLTFSYQARRVLNNRTLVRGYFYNREGKLIATAIQEGLTLAFKGFETIPEETSNYQDLKVRL